MAAKGNTNSSTESKPARAVKPMSERDFYLVLAQDADVEAVQAAVKGIATSPAALVDLFGKHNTNKFVKTRLTAAVKGKSL